MHEKRREGLERRSQTVRKGPYVSRLVTRITDAKQTTVSASMDVVRMKTKFTHFF